MFGLAQYTTAVEVKSNVKQGRQMFQESLKHDVYCKGWTPYPQAAGTIHQYQLTLWPLVAMSEW